MNPAAFDTDWLKSDERRQILVATKNTPANVFLEAYWRKVLLNTRTLSFILNVGSGIGTHANNLNRIKSRFVRYVGMDFDPECVKRCRKYFTGHRQFQFCNVNCESLPNLPREFDYTAITFDFTFLPDYEEFLQHFWASSRKGLVLLADQLQAPTVTVLRELFDGASEFKTVYNHDESLKQYAVLVRRDCSVPDFSRLRSYAMNSQFPHNEDWSDDIDDT